MQTRVKPHSAFFTHPSIPHTISGYFHYNLKLLGYFSISFKMSPYFTINWKPTQKGCFQCWTFWGQWCYNHVNTVEMSLKVHQIIIGVFELLVGDLYKVKLSRWSIVWSLLWKDTYYSYHPPFRYLLIMFKAIYAFISRRNFLDLVIYFEELNYQEIKQVAAYDWTTLLSKCIISIRSFLNNVVDTIFRIFNSFFHSIGSILCQSNCDHLKVLKTWRHCPNCEIEVREWRSH